MSTSVLARHVTLRLNNSLPRPFPARAATAAVVVRRVELLDRSTPLLPRRASPTVLVNLVLILFYFLLFMVMKNRHSNISLVRSACRTELAEKHCSD